MSKLLISSAVLIQSFYLQFFEDAPHCLPHLRHFHSRQCTEVPLSPHSRRHWLSSVSFQARVSSLKIKSKNTPVRAGGSSCNVGVVLKECPQEQCFSAGDSSAPQTTPGSVGRYFLPSGLAAGAPSVEPLEAGGRHSPSQCPGPPTTKNPNANSRVTNPALTFFLNFRELILLSNNLFLSGIKHPVSHITGENCCYNEHPFCAVSALHRFFPLS